MNGNPTKNSAPVLNAKVPAEGCGIDVHPTICNPHSRCGIDAYVKDGTIIKVERHKDNPQRGGTLCSKSAASRQYIYGKERAPHLLCPA